MSLEQIRKQLRSGELARLYVLYGDEDYLKSLYCGRIEKKAVEAMEGFNLHRFDREISLSQLTAALDNLPVMSRYKCVVLRDVDPDGLKAEEWKQLQPVLKNIPEDCVMILHFDAVPYNKKSSRWRTLLGIAEKIGVAAEIGRQSRSELIRWLQKNASEAGCELTSDCAGILVDICGDDMNTLRHELDKVCAYTDAGRITRETVEKLAIRPLDASVYDLTRAVTGKNLDRALAILQELFERKEEPVVILSTISGAICDLFRAKTARLSGAGATEIMAAFPYPGREFRVRNAIRDCANLDLPTLRSDLALLMRADESLKSSRADNRVILERLVVEMVAVGKGRKVC